MKEEKKPNEKLSALSSYNFLFDFHKYLIRIVPKKTE